MRQGMSFNCIFQLDLPNNVQTHLVTLDAVGEPTTLPPVSVKHCFSETRRSQEQMR